MHINAILAALKTKFPGVEESILMRIARSVAKTVTTEEGVQPAVDAVTVQQLLQSYGDSRANEAQISAVETYEKKHGLKDGKAIPASPEAKPASQPAANEEVPAWATKFMDSLKSVSDRLDAMDKASVAANRKSQLDSVISKLPENLRKAYARMNYDGLKDDEFSTLLGEVTSEVDAICQTEKAKGVVFGAASTAGQPAGEELTKAQLDAISSRGAQAPEGQPF